MTPERPLVVLHLAANRWWTGSADPTIRLAVGLRARGHRILLGAIPGDRFESNTREAGLKAGGEIVVPTRADHAQLMNLMLPIGAEVTATKPQEKAMYELLLKAAKRTE